MKRRSEIELVRAGLFEAMQRLDTAHAENAGLLRTLEEMAVVHRQRFEAYQLDVQRLRILLLLQTVLRRESLRKLLARYDELLDGSRRDGWTRADAREIEELRELAK